MINKETKIQIQDKLDLVLAELNSLNDVKTPYDVGNAINAAITKVELAVKLLQISRNFKG